MTLVSAHEYGARHGRAGASASEQLCEALALGADFVEFDVRRTADGEFVVLHDHEVEIATARRAVVETTLAELRSAGVDLLTYAEALAIVRGMVRAHLDLKFVPPASSYDGPDAATWEVLATAQAVEALGADQVVVTTLEDRGVAAVRRWASTAYPDLLVGLSLGRSRAGLSLRRQVAGRLSELFPARRVRACDANVVVANRWLARFGVARWTSRRGLRLLVWTVDDRRGLRRWLTDPRCWTVTTNNVRQAVRIRDGYRD